MLRRALIDDRSWLWALIGLVLILGVVAAMEIAQARTMIRDGHATVRPPSTFASAALASNKLDLGDAQRAHPRKPRECACRLVFRAPNGALAYA